jgi:flagellum-specific ATP synthase
MRAERLAARMGAAAAVRPAHPAGTVTNVVGFEVHIAGIRAAVGDGIRVAGRDAEVIAARAGGLVALVAGEIAGIGPGDGAVTTGARASAPVSDSLLGRVVDPAGRALDGRPDPRGAPAPLDRPAPPALERGMIVEHLPTGVKVLDCFTTLGKGQRIGLFAGSGVGKSTLLGMVARGAAADVIVIALVGERGREVAEFLEHDLPLDARHKTVTVVATSDQPPLTKLRAGLYATSIAEHFADQGLDVVLLLDSVTRLAAAQRDVGLAAGEPPTARGYTPSVFSMLPRLLERAGPRPGGGTITGIYTVLVDGDDHVADPVADAVRGILDGHVVLDRSIATRGRYPAVNVPESLSRLAAKLLPDSHQQVVGAARAAWSAAERVRDLVDVGAYVPGANPAADEGLLMAPSLETFCTQQTSLCSDFDDAWDELASVVLEARRAAAVAADG